jgi:hypothetical protein
MRFVTWATVLLVPFSVLACASQSAEESRQMKDLAARVRQLSTNYERLEERLGAVEALERYKTGTADNAPSPSNTRPNLPTVMAGPNEQPMTESAPPEPGRAAESSSDDSHRLMIVGEGSRVETRVDGDVRSTPTVASPPSKNSRAAKRNANSVSGTSSGGANP